MDANGLRFWMLADRSDWAMVEEPARLTFDAPRRCLHLASERPPVAWVDRPDTAEGRLALVPWARDAYGLRAVWIEGLNAVAAQGDGPGIVTLFTPDPGSPPTDLAVGFDGAFAIAAGGKIRLIDLRETWEPVTVGLDGFAAWRLAGRPAGGFWALDRTSRRVARLYGSPPRERRVSDDPTSESALPCGGGATDPPRLVAGPALPVDDDPVALAASPSGRLALLCWTADDHARLRLVSDDLSAGPPIELVGIRRPFSLAWLDETRVAMLLAGSTEAAAFEVADGVSPAVALGDYYPLRDHDGGPFLHGLDVPPHVPIAAANGPATAPLYPLSLASFARDGGAENASEIDSGDPQTVWHRLYIEAVIPPRCAVQVSLAVDDHATGVATPVDRLTWHDHWFGDAGIDRVPSVPRGAWVSTPSELPFQPGLLRPECGGVPGRAGLFTTLVQRAGYRQTSLRGQFVRVRVTLHGDGRSTPEVAALRIYASRFSYRDRYLPELYHETDFGPEADAARGPASPADFLERFLDNFEGVLTPIEDRIAASYLLTDPRTAPDDALDWLATWVGIAFEPGYPPDRRREHLGRAGELARTSGTLRGFNAALDVATGGAVRRGEVVAVEDFRFRRTLATILGASTVDADDPLLQGLAVSGNSEVGETLFLGDDRRREFLALFRADPTASEAQIDALLGQLAYRVTVLVHDVVHPHDLGLIRRVAEVQTPAHVAWRLELASAELVVGMASLMGIDTYLGPPEPPAPATLGVTVLGEGDRVQHPPRLDGGRPMLPPERPVARATAPEVVAAGDPFNFDASASSAPTGQSVVNYRWTYLGPA